VLAEVVGRTGREEEEADDGEEKAI